MIFLSFPPQTRWFIILRRSNFKKYFEISKTSSHSSGAGLAVWLVLQMFGCLMTQLLQSLDSGTLWSSCGPHCVRKWCGGKVQSICQHPRSISGTYTAAGAFRSDFRWVSYQIPCGTLYKRSSVTQRPLYQNIEKFRKISNFQHPIKIFSEIVRTCYPVFERFSAILKTLSV